MEKGGFSLVELSIVLVILGLLTGGILTGQSLIAAAELRAVTTEFSQWQTATNSFRTKYLEIPGDFSKAESFWDSMSDCSAANPTATAMQSCNGNGDGIVEDGLTGDAASELFGFWQHLANAGMVEGQYSGLAGTIDAWDAVHGNNVPSSRYSGAAWMVIEQDYTAGNPYLYAYDYQRLLHIDSIL